MTSLVAACVLLRLGLIRGLGKCSTRRRIGTAAVALFFVPVFGVDPNSILRLDAEAQAGFLLDQCYGGGANEQVACGYDLNGNLTQIKVKDQSGGSVLRDTYAYDPEITYEHDLDGRVTKKVTSEQKTYFFHWSPGGRLETVGDDPCNPSDAYGSFQYEVRGRLSDERREYGDAITCAYDKTM